MIGRPVEQYFPEHLDSKPGHEKLRLEGLTSPGRFQDISLTVRAGEVVGLAGLVGAGRSEIARAIFGLDPKATGRIFIEGREVRIGSPRQAMSLGIGLLPEDRKTQGLVLSMGGRANLSLPILSRLSRLGFVRAGREKALTRRYFDRLRVRTPHMDAPVWSLSGGNQQKIAMAKWLASEPRVLILDEPTRGVDIGAKMTIHSSIEKLAREGSTVLLISSDLPELVGLCDRVMIMRKGHFTKEMDYSECSEESLLLAANGEGSA